MPFINSNFIYFILCMGLCILLTGCEARSSRPNAQISASPEQSPVSVENPTGLPVVQPLGIKADLMFATPIKDPDDRMARLENAMIDMRRDFDATLPTFQRLDSIQGDIQELAHQLKTLMADMKSGSLTVTPSSNVAPPPVLQSRPTPQTPDAIIKSVDGNAPYSPHMKKPAGAPPPSAMNAPKKEISSVVAAALAKPAVPSTVMGQGVGVSDKKPLPVIAATRQVKLIGIRVGVHSDKVRIVMDSAKHISVTDDLDSAEKILVLDIGGADVETAQGPLAANDIVSKVSLRGTGPGVGQAVFELKKLTSVQKISSLPPSKDNPNYRTIIDLKN